ncbi:uncharacterized protein LOC142605782 [Castanea sativa]|uniref:uncharacterized protein LOC142605782 n=1 Tax=Castanea sativa TaxID=21020 RepID=UPI003F64B0C8
MAATLNRFIIQSMDMCKPFFKLLNKWKGFEWIEECVLAFQQLKEYLSRPPVMSRPEEDKVLFAYVTVASHAVSLVLIRVDSGMQRLIYYVSKSLHETEGTILGAFDIKYLPRTSVKGQVLTNLVAEFAESPLEEKAEKQNMDEKSVGMVEGELEVKDSMIQEYLGQVKHFQSGFDSFTLLRIHRSRNAHADSLTTLATSSVQSLPRVILIEDLCKSTEMKGKMGLAIVGPFPKAVGNRRWLLVGMDYFTKWVEAEPLANIRDIDAKRFFGKNIVTRFGIPHTLISDNDLQFDSKAFKRYCCDLGIMNRYSTLAYPQGNGQVKAVNKVILNGLKKRSTGETPFSITYEIKAVIPLETEFPTLRTNSFTPSNNDRLLEKSLDLIKERREIVMVQLAYYQHKLKQGYDSNVRIRPLAPGD